MVEASLREAALRQSKQAGATDNAEAAADQYRIELARGTSQSNSHALGPLRVCVRLKPSADRIRGNRLITERGAKTCDEWRRCDRESKPNASQSVELAEGTQHDDAWITFGASERGDAAGWVRIGEGFVDHKKTLVRGNPVVGFEQLFTRSDGTVSTIGIDERDHGARRE